MPRPDDAAQEAYPFDYRFEVRYEFEEASFKVFLTLENCSTNRSCGPQVITSISRPVA